MPHSPAPPPEASAALLPLYPFAALQGQPALQQALLLAAIDPAIGGVLIEGPSGTAKSTAARGLAELLEPDAPFVTLPLGASLEHLAGSLDLGRALAGHSVQFAPGLLARAHGGVLYVDEINLLPDALVDVLLDAAASGVHRVERDGISHSHAARFVLIGTMNPEEGALRPQLLDRLGLCVRLDGLHDAAQRQHIVKARLAFDADPIGFRARHAAAQQALAAQLQAARQRLHSADALPWSDAVHAAAAEHCLAAQVHSLRADMVLLRAARALAAWESAAHIGTQHVEQVAELVLAHRRRPASAHQAAQIAHAAQADSPPQPAPQAQGTPRAAAPEGAPAHGSNAPHQGPNQPRNGHSGHSHHADAHGGGAGSARPASEADWGALPPEPAGLQPLGPGQAPGLNALPPHLHGQAGAPGQPRPAAKKA
ncbi:ATP-binding protein [Vandammella animalimorsus]|uniref:Magnesium chelatase n=1 Tax=Vandammella animalimorsus TaxID=2029117 RepID=A0A2A2AK78_9BURK|nr:ATP-binding protein [Vandammella animalimorsus]PAT38226.1 magnesium chelatase [Vandammella animalimorsus]RMX15900.1 magnesium chelatase [Vandammella animalimorsus]